MNSWGPGSTDWEKQGSGNGAVRQRAKSRDVQGCRSRAKCERTRQSVPREHCQPSPAEASQGTAYRGGGNSSFWHEELCPCFPPEVPPASIKTLHKRRVRTRTDGYVCHCISRLFSPFLSRSCSLTGRWQKGRLRREKAAWETRTLDNYQLHTFFYPPFIIL